MSSNEWEQARAYVEEMREDGRTDQEIRQVLLDRGWQEDQVEKLFAPEPPQAAAPPPAPPPAARPDAAAPPASVPTPARGPRRPARAADISQGAKIGIILCSIFVPIAGLIWGLIYLFSGQAAKKRYGAWGLGISVLVGLIQAALVATVLAALAPAGVAFGQAREKAVQTSCLSNMSQLALGALMYSADSDGHLPDADKWQQQLLAYPPRTDQVFHCPKGGTYAMNPEVSGLSIRQIDNPATTVLFYEVDNSGNPLYDVHMGKANYAYADGHAASRERSE